MLLPILARALALPNWEFQHNPCIALAQFSVGSYLVLDCDHFRLDLKLHSAPLRDLYHLFLGPLISCSDCKRTLDCVNQYLGQTANSLDSGNQQRPCLSSQIRPSQNVAEGSVFNFHQVYCQAMDERVCDKTTNLRIYGTQHERLMKITFLPLLEALCGKCHHVCRALLAWIAGLNLITYQHFISFWHTVERRVIVQVFAFHRASKYSSIAACTCLNHYYWLLSYMGWLIGHKSFVDKGCLGVFHQPRVFERKD